MELARRVRDETRLDGSGEGGGRQEEGHKHGFIFYCFSRRRENFQRRASFMKHDFFHEGFFS